MILADQHWFPINILAPGRFTAMDHQVKGNVHLNRSPGSMDRNTLEIG